MSDASAHVNQLSKSLRDIVQSAEIAQNEVFLMGTGEGGDDVPPSMGALRGALMTYRDRALKAMESPTLHDEGHLNRIWRATEIALAVIDPEYLPDQEVRSDALDIASRF